MSRIYETSEVAQRTTEWLRLRLGKFTGTDVAKVYAGALSSDGIGKGAADALARKLADLIADAPGEYK